MNWCLDMNLPINGKNTLVPQSTILLISWSTLQLMLTMIHKLKLSMQEAGPQDLLQLSKAIVCCICLSLND